MIIRSTAFFVFLFATNTLFAAETSDEQSLASLSSPVSASALMQTTLGLIVVVAFIVLIAWLLKRTNSLQSSANGQLKVIAGLPVGTRERILLIEAGEEQVLIGVTAQQINTLHVLNSPIDVTPTSSQPQFADKLKQILNQQAK